MVLWFVAVIAWPAGGAFAAQTISPASFAHSSACAPLPYPGDDAVRSDIAAWMASRMTDSMLPRELPVMAALVESGMRNLPSGDADAAGYFQMRTGIWDSGPYAGFPSDPDLQMQWFIDRIVDVRDSRLAAGRPDPALDETQWGAWIADVERPAEQFRGRYQLRLSEARGLLEPVPTCEDPETPDTTAPTTSIRTPKATVTTRKPSVRVRFLLASSQEGSRFRCQVDDGEFRGCSSPQIYRLRPGKHHVRAVAIDPAGNRDRTPASVAVQVKRER